MLEYENAYETLQPNKPHKKWYENEIAFQVKQIKQVT